VKRGVRIAGNVRARRRGRKAPRKIVGGKAGVRTDDGDMKVE
jgi:hypothetical protein